MTGTLWLIAGPNGVGKTTYARRYLRSVAGTSAFVNLDEIGRGLSPLEPTPDARISAAAARIALGRIARAIVGRQSFAVETTSPAAPTSAPSPPHGPLAWGHA